jgi:hypothetical protein
MELGTHCALLSRIGRSDELGWCPTGFGPRLVGTLNAPNIRIRQFAMPKSSIENELSDHRRLVIDVELVGLSPSSGSDERWTGARFYMRPRRRSAHDRSTDV